MAKTQTKPRVLVAKNYKALCRRAADEILALAKQSIKARGCFTVVFSGGTTPKGVYALMAHPVYRKEFPWDKTYFFMDDERFVARDSGRSNLKMIQDALLSKVILPKENLHTIKTDTKNARTAAQLYEKEIRTFFGLTPGGSPVFDLVLLGLGRDGHTLSLFPGHAALKEKKRLVIAVTAKGVPEQRITVTLPVVNHSRNVFFLVSGGKKADILHTVLFRKTKPLLPAQMVRPVKGKLTWFVDQNAVGNKERGK